MSDEKVAILYLTFDGVSNTYHGIGTQAQYFIDTYATAPSIRANYSLHIAVPDGSYSRIGYIVHSDHYTTMRQTIAAAGAVLHELYHDSGPLWTTEKWDCLTLEAIGLCLRLLREYERVVVIAVDAVYARLAPRLSSYLTESDSQRLRVVYALYSSAKVPGTLGPARRADDEQSAVHAAQELPWVYVADIGTYFTEHLQNEFGLDRNRLAPFRLGFSLTSPDLQPMSLQQARAQVSRLGIPVDRPVVFAMGRADPIKGLSTIIRAVAKTDAACHFVLIAVDYNAGSPAEIRKYRSLIDTYQVPCTFFDRFSRVIPRALCSLPDTHAVVTASVGEALGQIPSETGLWARKARGAVIVAPALGGYIEQIDNERSGFLYRRGDEGDLTAKIELVLAMTQEERAQAARCAYEKVVYERDNARSVKDLLTFIDSTW